ncbi:Heat shock protein STI1 [Folsomia candida]|uniref:Heat shock protein STI1 n=1 Tax=Folsomia candida TaxID=158441 RepID=A0A226DN36_FOLCA|nr:Heat shock protein STI1 [Folsomia candida]
MDNYNKLELLLVSTTSVIQELFLIRWLASQGCEWTNSKSFGDRLIQKLSKLKNVYKNFQKIQREMLQSGDVNTWDITLITLLLKQPIFEGYKTEADITNENTVIEEASKIRNQLAHKSLKTLNDDEFMEHVSNIRRILGVLSIPQEHIDDMCADARKGAIYSHRRAVLLKDEGNLFYSSDQFNEARDAYTRAIGVSENLPNDLLGVLYSNRSQTYIKMISKKMSDTEQQSYYKLALADGLEAMKQRPEWSKAFFRVAEAYRGLSRWKQAIDNYERFCVLEPTLAKSVKEKLDICKIMANIILIADPEDEEGLPMSFDERIKNWNDDPTSDGVMTRRRWMTREALRTGESYTMMGHRYRMGWDTKIDLNEAMRCYIKAKNLDDTEGIYWLARMKFRGQVSDPDATAGFELLEEGANNIILDERERHWVAVCQYALGSSYHNGLGVEQDHAKAEFWYTKCSQESHDAVGHKAEYMLGCMYFTGDGVPLNKELAVAYWKQAARGKHPNAMLQLCKYYSDERMISDANEQVKAMRHFGLSESYIEQAEKITNWVKEMARKIDNRPILRKEHVSTLKPDKFTDEILLPYVAKSALARKIVEAKRKHAELVTVLTTSVGDMPLKCVDLFFEAYQPDVEVVHQIGPSEEFVISCKEILSRGNITKESDRKLRFCIAQSTRDETSVLWLEETIKLYPDDALFKNLLSNVYGFLQRNEDGLKLVNEVLKNDPSNRDALFGRATHLKHLGKVPDAIRATNDFLQSVEKDDRKRPEFFYTLGLLHYLQTGNEDGTQKFLSYYEQGKKAESDLLPCFLPYENNVKTQADFFAKMIRLRL